jgi:hypothetical protein
MPQIVWIIASILIVLILIGAVAWLVRRFSGNNLGSGGNRSRMPRLAVVDAAAVDGRRRLVLVRRDNVEHLIMIGGPTDVVVEPNINRNVTQREPAPSRGPVGTELPARAVPLPDANHWADNDGGRGEVFDFPEPAPVPERAARQSHFEEPRRPSPSIADRGRGDEFNGLIPEPPVTREPVNRAEPRAVPRSERAEPAMARMPRAADVQPRAPAAPAPRASSRSADPANSAADQNLAEMAQRLEAALRRPGERPETGGGRGGNVAIDPMDRVGAPPVAPAAPRSPPASAKPAYDNLEDEMANLLGRPKTPT